MDEKGQKLRIGENGNIEIADLNKADVLAALYNNAKAQGMGFLHYKPEDMTLEQAQAILDSGQVDFDYLHGRVMKVNLSETSFDPYLYDRDNGQGAALAAVESAARNETQRSKLPQTSLHFLQDPVFHSDPHVKSIATSNAPLPPTPEEMLIGLSNAAMARSSEIVKHGGEILARQVSARMKEVTLEEIKALEFENEADNFFFQSVPGLDIAAKRLSIALTKLEAEGIELPSRIGEVKSQPAGYVQRLCAFWVTNIANQIQISA